MNHYLRTWRHFWQRRKELNGVAFTQTEADFLPSALSLQERPVSGTARLTGRVLLALFALLLGWSYWGQLDIVVLATGKIIPSSHTKSIASVDVASVKAVHVLEGQEVKAGDVLVELDTGPEDAEHGKATKSRSEALLKAARARGMIDAIDRNHIPVWPSLLDMQQADANIDAIQWQLERTHLEAQYRDHLSKLQRIDGDIAHCRAALPLITQQASDYRALLQEHDVSQHAWLEKEQARLALEAQLLEAENRRSELITEARTVAYDQLIDSQNVAAAAQQDALRVASHARLLKLTAPIDGTVQQLNVHTVGGVVPAAQPLMQIVPSANAIEVEATIENKDIGFVQEGQTAAVKVDAFEYTRYGTIPATVTHVSRDAVPDDKRGLLYTVKITLDKKIIVTNQRAVSLSPGLAVSVEVKTGSRRVLDYLMSPILREAKESMHER
ncbi:HlyD family type I secretion periplasmic adaptor subunit [Duganella margarita]|uniref:HlyD family type I secretion periplasmic adaptor subunit n=1 Tax=Duganella margarita TaxID=2692170 RepID=UPI001E4681E4|nr:HlyD family type I secretion periplasmic adaptor subunit [Duganella margarita]